MISDHPSERPCPKTVKAYLDELRRALKGAPAGLIADALADTEDHLNNEISHNPDVPESQILASVIDIYGAPQEIAEEYRDMEATIGGPFPKSEPAPERRYGFFNVVSDPRSYGALLYMLLSLATGIVYFTWTLTFGIVSSVFMIFIIGLPLMLFFLMSVRVLAHAEGRIVEALLGQRMPRRPPTSAAPVGRGYIIPRLKMAASDITTWTSMLYLFLMLPLGIIYFVLAVVTMVVPLTISAAAVWGLVTNQPIIDVHGAIITIGDADLSPWAHQFLQTAPGLACLALVGILMFFLMLHVARGIGWLHGRLAELLLVRL